jgi:hypothetical protein
MNWTDHGFVMEDVCHVVNVNVRTIYKVLVIPVVSMNLLNLVKKGSMPSLHFFPPKWPTSYIVEGRGPRTRCSMSRIELLNPMTRSVSRF